jgi:integrase
MMLCLFLEFATGLRRGEILGLEWDDINFDDNKIRINKQWTVIKGKACWSNASTGTKTETSNRVIAVPHASIAALQARYNENPNDRYVFQSLNGNPIDPNNFRRDFKKYVKEAAQNINNKREEEKSVGGKIELVTLDKFRFHDLRHNYATQLVALNIHTRLIQAQLGHKDARATRRYTHATEQGQHDAAEKIGQFLTAINPGCCQNA